MIRSKSLRKCTNGVLSNKLSKLLKVTVDVRSVSLLALSSGTPFPLHIEIRHLAFRCT